MILLKPCARYHSLGLKPEKELNIVLFAFFSYRSKSVREIDLVNFPCADEGPFVVPAGIPAGV